MAEVHHHVQAIPIFPNGNVSENDYQSVHISNVLVEDADGEYNSDWECHNCTVFNPSTSVSCECCQSLMPTYLHMESTVAAATTPDLVEVDNEDSPRTAGTNRKYAVFHMHDDDYETEVQEVIDLGESSWGKKTRRRRRRKQRMVAGAIGGAVLGGAMGAGFGAIAGAAAGAAVVRRISKRRERRRDERLAQEQLVHSIETSL